MKDSSIFTTMTRFVPSSKHMPREDSLTQSFLVALEVANEAGLPRFLATSWGLRGMDLPEVSAKLETQRFLQKKTRRVDLSMEFDDPAGGRAKSVWVEVKHGSDLSGSQQLHVYDAAHRAEFAVENARLVFLAPIGFEIHPKDLEPANLIKTNWQETGEAVHSWLKEAGKLDPQVEWTVRQFLQFLKEERLFVDEPVTERTLNELVASVEATERMNFVLDRTYELVKSHVHAHPEVFTGQEEGPKGSPRWPDFWKNYSLVNSPAGVWAEWCLRPSNEFSDGPVFGAGISFEKNVSTGDFGEEANRGIDGAPGLVEFCHENRFDRLFSWVPVSEFAENFDGQPSEQAELIASWVRKAISTSLAVLEERKDHLSYH